MKVKSFISAIVKSLIITITCVNIYADTGGNPLSVETDKLLIKFSNTGADPVQLISYYPSKASSQTASAFSNPVDPAIIRFIISDDPELNIRLSELKYTIDREENGQSIVVRFTSEHLEEAVYFEKIYKISKQSYLIEVVFRICGEDSERFAKSHNFKIATGHGKSFMPKSFPGFSGSMERLRWIYLNEGKVDNLYKFSEKNQSDTLKEDQWAGFRNRFWAFLIQPKGFNVLLKQGKETAHNEMYFNLPAQQDEFSFCIYAGPIDYSELKNKAPGLSKLIFTHLWFWMRWLCFGLLFLLNFLIRLAGNHGIAIIFLSVSVKIIMLPLVKVAEKWQEEVNEKKSRLQPFIDEIKVKYKGEEQNRRILELHKQHNISPLFTLKSLFSALIQIPFFIAAYDMLSESIALRGVRFLWIEDLSLPDRLLQLPFYIPFLGEHLNLLPFLMTGITLLTSWYFQDASLSKSLLKKQKRNLYIMAVLFFILFYTFPAGMVLYWTTNNFFSLIKTLKRDKRPGFLK